MKAVKTFSDLRNIQDVKGTNAYIRGAKPSLPTTSILQLQQRSREKRRLLRQQHQIASRLTYLDGEIERAYGEALAVATTLRGKEEGEKRSAKGKGRMVLEY